MATKTETVTDLLEAVCRRIMAQVATMPRRGWDNERERAARIAELDDRLDEYNRAR